MLGDVDSIDAFLREGRQPVTPSITARAKQISRLQFRVRRYMGDGLYDWAVFKNGRPYRVGCARGEARHVRWSAALQMAKKEHYETV